MDGEGAILPITFRPIVLFSIGVWGWALNLLILTRCGIDLNSILQIHPIDKHTPLYKSVFFLSGLFSIILFLNLVLYWFYQSETIALFSYIFTLVLVLWPGKSLYRKERMRFIRMLKRVFSINIFASVFFSDIILADMMTSFSNVFGDLFIANCIIFSGHDSSYFMDNTHNIYYFDIMVPLLIGIPYLIRLRQCITEYIEFKEKRHLLNALKYASSIPVVIFSALYRKATIYIAEMGTVPTHWPLKEDTIFRIWILLVFINSMYSFWWDISVDWNLINVTLDSQQHQKKTTLLSSSTPLIHFRRQLYFPQTSCYILAIFFDFLLRITWSFKLSSHFYIRKLDTSLFLMGLLEILRRWIWVIFRIENEWVKKVYSVSLPNTLDQLRMNRLDRKPSSSSSSGLLPPIAEEESLL
ncbi:EXS family-domain-containing protein [Cokeromyces recurvatus]|uniref:EXS family-domain-containing protein n=1 Tax=Cokeromyces recurvatus TaxID=90255 RepID=UPI002220D9E6|nr:EXS family-domain-containing protein [Cokeromyces recurvatus]KAI7903246.1 EXS family-domain-containing protein [Cokeromyces recurvatus]